MCCAAVCHRVVAVGPVARRGLGSWGGPHASHRGAVGVTEVCVHKGWARRPGLRLSADGGLPSIAARQCPDLVACAV